MPDDLGHPEINPVPHRGYGLSNLTVGKPDSIGARIYEISVRGSMKFFSEDATMPFIVRIGAFTCTFPTTSRRSKGRDGPTVYCAVKFVSCGT